MSECKRYVLNAGAVPPDCTTEDKRHKWVTVSSPSGHYSGYHVEKCSVCGIIQEYDTSD